MGELSIIVDKDYVELIKDIKHKIKMAQFSAHRAVNTELIRMYWSIGKNLLERQKIEKWGSKYLEQVSKDLKVEFPEIRGFSVRNLKYMRLFVSTYSSSELGQQPVAQLAWGHIVVLLDKIKDPSRGNWYALQALEGGWSRNVLTMMIKQDLYARQKMGSKVTNFKETLPELQSDMAEEMFRDPYNFEFLTIQEPVHERAIENALVDNIRDFLLQLGRGFAFVGSQYPVEVGDDDFFIDCLFYNIKMHCYVVIELKTGKFKPEYAGQLNFYLTAIDKQVKSAEDNATIGIMLCETKNEIVAQYAVDGMTKPMGISQYELGEVLTKRLKQQEVLEDEAYVE